MIELPRRRFLQCLTGIIAAPAVVKADSLMRVFAPKARKLTAEEIELLIRPPLIADCLPFQPLRIVPGRLAYIDGTAVKGFWPLFDLGPKLLLPAADQRA